MIKGQVREDSKTILEEIHAIEKIVAPQYKVVEEFRTVVAEADRQMGADPTPERALDLWKLRKDMQKAELAYANMRAYELDLRNELSFTTLEGTESTQLYIDMFIARHKDYEDMKKKHGYTWIVLEEK
jgi:hypothetical protein